MNNMVFNDLVIDRDQQEIIDSVEIEFELNRLLTERRFRSSPQMAAFLRYIVDETLKGNARRIKVFSINRIQEVRQASTAPGIE